ncbi:hypothetical protein M427DRAFT_42092 [Gonapodya prolifera JEL478]|uniref:GST N-terminal domain-containing protein n=1 Tax=Gonapodya prolifera (strain JEL478) TaxID=1344416 RepID=A0A139ARG7_GONPJ|nr:hypothetical protein M427DRAFT_42092 [Gonapodya prolifera JEL478]|eukprot:KXS19328.1 hypothetical protein M427DRAFT_42092 [Gonapodya prolifera JEL478]
MVQDLDLKAYTATPILHGYDESPVTHKIILYLQIKGIPWVYHRTSKRQDDCLFTATSHFFFANRNVTPDLSRGYRRIPILQIGTDGYCDSNAIIRELEKR